MPGKYSTTATKGEQAGLEAILDLTGHLDRIEAMANDLLTEVAKARATARDGAGRVNRAGWPQEFPELAQKLTEVPSVFLRALVGEW